MVRISIVDVQHFAEDYAGHINVDKIKKRLNALLISVEGSQSHIDYIKKLISELDKGLLTITPSQMDSLCNQFSELKASLSAKFGERQIPFHKMVIDAMNYEMARSHYRRYVPMMGIKTCVYCNAQYAVSFTSKSGNEYAQFEVDHWKPKSEYPFLSISFYNFVPSCPSCNKHKTEKDLMFSFYSDSRSVADGMEYDPFVFRLTDENLSRFLSTYNSDLLKLEFKSRDGNLLLEKDYSRFAIDEMYKCFRDEAALTIRRFLFYNNAYREQLQKSYGKNFSMGFNYDELIYGVPFGQKDVLRRPLAKMIQDIRSQLETSSVYYGWLKKKGY